jgi:predicted anti-sigma-YlaC factor YlaD
MAVAVVLLNCNELVELVTDYLEGVLAGERRASFEEHLRGCEACVGYVEQMRRTIALTGELREEDVSQEALAELGRTFARWKAG